MAFTHYTSIEQSKRLLELGLSPETADMFYLYGMNVATKVWSYDAEPTVIGEVKMDIGDLPCWSLGALLELMPIGSHIEKINNIYSCYGVYAKSFKDSTSVGAAYNAICWLLEQGRLNKKG